MKIQENEGKESISPFLKLGLELGPLVVFFLANAYAEELVEVWPRLDQLGGNLIVGTAFFMVAMIVSQAISIGWLKHVAIMPLVTLGFLLVFGGLTLLLKDEVFIKMKPTIVNGLFAVILLGGLALGRSFLSYLLEASFHLDEEGWRKLTARWGMFFVFMAVLNEIVWRNFSSDFWVGFKVWGTMPITFVFMMAQLPLVMRHHRDGGQGG